MNVLSNIDLVLDYLDNMADVVDGDYGQPEPNEEMNLARELQEARDAVVALVGAMKRALPTVEHMYHTNPDPDGSLWDDVLACRNALSRFGG
jgi:hypothetical protein